MVSCDTGGWLGSPLFGDDIITHLVTGGQWGYTRQGVEIGLFVSTVS